MEEKKILHSSCKKQLNQALTNHLANNQNHLPKIAVFGIGNELNGDDAAGVLAVRQLQRLLPSFSSILLVEASVAPENYTGKLRAFQPDWVWLLDAAEMGLKPGEVQLVDWQSVQGVSAVTHGLPPTLFARFVQKEFGASIFLFGVQPEVVDSFIEPTEKIVKTAHDLADTLADWVKQNYAKL